MSIENYLTASEAAALIGCSSARVRQLIQQGVLSGKKLSPRMWLVERKDAEKIRDLPYTTGRPRILGNST